MQISSINNQISYKGDFNSDRIKDLQQKSEALRWSCEGCNGSLSIKDEHELDLRTEYKALQDRYIATRWGSEGCNGSLSIREMQRMEEIEKELREMNEAEAESNKKYTKPDSAEKQELKDETGYGVSPHVFWGDWAN